MDGVVEAGVFVPKQSNFLIDYDNATKSHKFPFTWSHTTTDEVEFSGKESDAVLVPNMSVEFRQVRRAS